MLIPAATSVPPGSDATGGSTCEARGGKLACASRASIVEMFGVPGVGKTTLANAAARGHHLKRQQLTVQWRRLAFSHKCLLLLLALLDLRCLWSAAVFACRTRLGAMESLGRLVRLVLKTRWMRSQSTQMILDQSFLQEIWSICIAAGRSDPDAASLIRFIRSLYQGLNAHIMFVEADPVTASGRLCARAYGASRLDGLSMNEVAARLGRMARLPDAITQAAAAAGLSVERLDGTRPVSVNARRLRALLDGERDE